MILGDRMRDVAPPGGPDRRVTLDDLFRRAVERRPEASALIDPPDRADFTDGLPRRLSFAQADRVVSAIAGRLNGLGLPVDSIVALQLPNIAESALALLGVLRAGMIAAPVPLLWRQVDMTAALGRIGARALIASRRVGNVDHGELAMQVAAETFAIRFVCGFGRELPDGVVPLDDLVDTPSSQTSVAVERAGDPVDHVAIVTFDVAADGMAPVARNHAELLAGGCAVLLEAKVATDAAILGALTTSSFAGLSSIIVPWLITGGTLTLHQPFNPAVFAAQRASDRCGLAVLPGALAARLDEKQDGGPGTVVGVWRTPERLPGSAAWSGSGPGLIDVAVFGEIGLIASRRVAGGKPVIPVGRVTAPRDAAGAPTVIETARGAAGTVTLRGPMVPRHPFPPGAERGERHRLKIGEDGFVDTGYTCRLERNTNNLIVDGPPAGIVTVGGYRFVLRELQDLVARIDEAGSVAALPDTFAGQRLAGVAHDREAVRLALAALGANPLLVAAFRERRIDRASAA